jgi:hypothetical protein
MPGSAACVQWKVPVRFTSSMRCHSAASVLPNGAGDAWPALLTRMSIGPKCRTACAKPACTDASSLTSSAAMATASGASARMDSTAAASACASRPASVTRAPRSSKARAQAAPMPRAPPVTSACFPASGRPFMPSPAFVKWRRQA